MQRIYNYGSFLQAYGLKKILQSLDADVNFVDYHPEEPILNSGEKNGILRKLRKAFDTFKIAAPLKAKIDYINYKRNYAENYYPLLGIEEKPTYKTNDLDLLVIGSDEVFNCIQDNPNVGFSPDLFGANAKSDRLITYAASFGNTTLSKLIDYNKEKEISTWLSKFDAISVRDRNSLYVVEKLIKKPVVQNLDPVLIYDFINNESLPNVNLPYKYLILYGYNGRFSKIECKEIKKYAKLHNLKIVCIGGVQNCCDIFLNCAPLEVLSYFKNADCVITDTFHGTIMSVITQQRFITFIRKNGYGNSQKLEDLLKKLKLTDRILSDLSNLDKELNNHISYEETERIIERERINSRNYLKIQLEKA